VSSNAEGAEGTYYVGDNPDDPRDLLIAIRTPEGTVPEGQKNLHRDVERTLSTLRMLLLDNDRLFREYYGRIRSLAQAGLSIPNANPEIAQQFLDDIKSDIISRFGGKVKNRYMRSLGIHALLLATGALIILGVVTHVPNLWDVAQVFRPLASALPPFLLLWVGCMAGVWLSFGARKRTLELQELLVIEVDQVEPLLRLVFTGLLSMVVGLFVSTGLLTIEVGGFSTKNFDSRPDVPLLLGVFLGLSEQVLSGRLLTRATQVVDEHI
jgi:hypothetical protein